MSNINEKTLKNYTYLEKLIILVIRKRDTMDINELKRILEKNKNEILDLWRSL